MEGLSDSFCKLLVPGFVGIMGSFHRSSVELVGPCLIFWVGFVGSEFLPSIVSGDCGLASIGHD